MKVVIFGRDAAAWLSANALQSALGPTGLTVEVVELPSLSQAQDIYPALPALEAFHGQMRIDEHALLKATGGSYSLGQSFTGFGPAPFFHAYGSHGVAIDRLPFFQYFTRARQKGLTVALEDFSLTAAGAKVGRFIVPDSTTVSFARTDYGYHLPAVAYVDYLRAKALKSGVRMISVRDAGVEQDAEGNITALLTRNGSRITGDLFIDASGSDAQLMRALEIGFESWRGWFRGDRVLAAAGAPYANVPPYARIEALDHGWQGLYAAQDRTRLVQVHDSRLISDDDALQMAARTSGLKLGDAVVSELNSGRSAQAWAKNCVAVGEAACVFDPIDSPGLHTIQNGLVHLLALFPQADGGAVERTEYNHLMQQGFERTRDFQIVHSALCGQSGAYWRALETALPETLTRKLETFRARGIVPMSDGEIYPLDSWEAILTGHGLVLETFEPLVEATSDADLMAHLKRMLGYIREQVQSMNSHDSYLELFCK
ncbi:tryptophan 7-halogenase [Asticcacaulis sp.]|uniref:tryptophan 7-halogenase n=1 Tax=Asticcacaulis sp. TaxID=1872648 RepID=UPI002CDD563F|nr:tryptophan 7-halogenase [Asticcacaulis sp.]HTM81737.1 tryptophan 7-halogenase [Asticcacaulis sp.]